MPAPLTPTEAAALLQTLRHGSAVEIDPRRSPYFAPCISCEHCEESAALTAADIRAFVREHRHCEHPDDPQTQTLAF